MKIESVSKNEPEKFSHIKHRSHLKSKRIYEQRMKKYYSAVHEQTKEIIEEHGDDVSRNRVLITENLKNLKKHFIELHKQNEALNSHVLLLNKALQQLTIQKQSLIQATIWQKRQIAKIQSKQALACYQSQ